MHIPKIQSIQSLLSALECIERIPTLKLPALPPHIVSGTQLIIYDIPKFMNEINDKKHIDNLLEELKSNGKH